MCSWNLYIQAHVRNFNENFCSGSSLISVWKMWKRKVYFYNKIRLLLGFLIVHLLWFTSFYRAFKSYFFMLLMDKDFYVINGSITVYISAYLWLNSISLSLLNKNISLWSLPFLIHWIDQMVVFQVIQMLIWIGIHFVFVFLHILSQIKAKRSKDFLNPRQNRW